MLKKLYLVGLVCCLLAPSSAFCDTPQFNFKKDNVYGSINVGATFLNDIGITTEVNWGSALTIDTATTVTFDAGGSISGTIGTILSELIRLEFELGYTEMNPDKAEAAATITFTSGGSTLTRTGSGSVDVAGQVEALYGFGNVVLTPLGSQSVGNGKLTPLIGGGVGYS